MCGLVWARKLRRWPDTNCRQSYTRSIERSRLTRRWLNYEARTLEKLFFVPRQPRVALR